MPPKSAAAHSNLPHRDPHVPGRDGDCIHRIVQTPDNAPVRGIISGRRVCATASLPLLKAKGTVQTEAGVEIMWVKDLEFRTDVVAVRSQPIRCEGVCRGVMFTMIPDFAILWADGRREIIEIKADPRQLDVPGYREKQELVAEGLAAHGWDYRTVFKHEFNNPIRRDNVELAFVCRFTPVLERHKAAVSALLRQHGGKTTFGHLCACLDPNPIRARAVAFAMMARRLVNIDFSVRLSDSTTVRSVPPLPAVMPSLRF